MAVRIDVPPIARPAMTLQSRLRTNLHLRARRLLRRGKRTLWRTRMPIRLLTADSRALPNFLIIGTQRGGTTSLYTYLCQHPQILRSTRKEVHFFDRHYDEGIRWYRAHFPLQSTLDRRGAQVGTPVLTGEATPYYLFHPDAPARIASVLPGARLIALLRDPIARAYSHYMLTSAAGKEDMTFKEAIRWERGQLEGAFEQDLEVHDRYDGRDHMRHSYLARGIYARQLTTFYGLFPRQHVWVSSSENLFRDPQTTYDGITDFLDLERHELQRKQPRNTGVYGDRMLQGIDDELLVELRGFFKPFNRELFELLGTAFDWEP